MGNQSNNFENEGIVSFGIVGVIIAQDIVIVDISEEIQAAEAAGAETRMDASDRTFLCNNRGNARCATACAGQACTATCTWNCGLGRGGSVLCSAVAAGTRTSG